jgi:hypothetical protein
LYWGTTLGVMALLCRDPNNIQELWLFARQILVGHERAWNISKSRERLLSLETLKHWVLWFPEQKGKPSTVVD